MAIVNIDFDEANKVTLEMVALNDEFNLMLSNTEKIKSTLNTMPSDFKSEVNASVENLDTGIKEVAKLLTETRDIFDRQISNYRTNEEEEISQRYLEFNSAFKTGTYDPTIPSNKMVKVSKEELGNYLSKTFNGISNGNTYNFDYNGMKCTFNYDTGRISINGESAKCDFYKSANTQLGNIKSVTAVIGGTGEVDSGEIPRLNGNTTICDDALVLDIYDYSDKNKNISKSNDIIAASTIVGDFISNSNDPKKVYNSVIGFSQGGQAASRAISSHKGLYQFYSPVNSNACWSGDVNNDLILRANSNGYQSFNDPSLDIVIARSKNDTEKFKVTQETQIERIIAAGRDPKSIVYLTNDDKIISNNSKGVTMAKYNSDVDGHKAGHDFVSMLLGYSTSLYKS